MNIAARFIIRLAGSGLLVLATGTLLYLVSQATLVVLLGIPALFLSGVVSALLEPWPDLTAHLASGEVEGPVIFATLVGLASTLFWWTVAFSLRPFLFRRRQNAEDMAG